MTIYSIGEQAPILHESVFVAASATIIGQVSLGAGCSVWPQAVLRADNEPIHIGAGTSIQDGAVLHNDPGFALVVGTGVTIGHQAMLHGCTIGDGSLIGIKAVILNGAVIGRNCLVGAGALVTEGKVFPDRSLIVGVPAKVVRLLTDADIEKISAGARGYVIRAGRFVTELREIARQP